MPVRVPLSLNSIATPVRPTRSTPSVKTIVEINIALSFESASTTSCLTLVGCWRYSFSLAPPKDFHCPCCNCKKTLHLNCAVMVEVMGPWGFGSSSTGELGGLGSRDGPHEVVAKEAPR